MSPSLPRRGFLIGTAAAGMTAVASSPEPVQAQPAPAAAPEPMQILSAAEAAFIGAVADAMIPADALSPSGSECGVVTYVDRQLAGAYGAGARLYRAGPFRPSGPGQGYQLPLTPLEYFRAGIAAADEWCRKSRGKPFDALAPAERDDVLKAIEAGTAAFGGLASKPFFAALLQIVMEGFFADPVYGGNRDKASWRMIGYPGLPATYADKIDSFRGKRYEAEPQSIVDFS